MAPSTDRMAFRALVAEIAAKAKAKLPQAVNGRIESAVKLVLAHDVLFREDGTIAVGSASDPLKTYILAGHACDCQDFAYGQAPDGWCQHRIAAGIAKRVQELGSSTRVETEPGLPVETSMGIPMDPAVPPALPEARCSVQVRVMIDGRDCQLTLRDTDEGRLLQRLAAVLKAHPVQAPASPQGQDQLSQQQHNAAAQHKRVSSFCKVHTVEMKQNHGQDGRTWYSHYDEAAGRWCKGK